MACFAILVWKNWSTMINEPVPCKVISNQDFDTDVYYEQAFKDYGIVRIQRWPEGLIIWVGGKIVYKSWVRIDVCPSPPVKLVDAKAVS